MNFRSCEYLLTIAEQKSLSKAAAVLGVSQPTLSNFLARTEQSLGLPLFTRKKKVMYPTAAGDIYLNACRRISETKNRTYHSIAVITNSYTERFTVGITPHRGSTLFGHIYPAFYHRYPDVKVDIREGYMGTLLGNINSGEVDLVVGTSVNNTMEGYEMAVHNQEELLLCVPDFHPLAKLSSSKGGRPAPVEIRKFQDTPFIMWGDQTTNHLVIQNHFKEQGITPTVVYESNNVFIIDSMLASGVGVGFLPASYCKDDQSRVYFSTIPPLKSVLGIFFRKGTVLTKAQRYFIFLSIKNQIQDSVTAVPCLNGTAKAIYSEFEPVPVHIKGKEMKNGYPSN